MFDLKTIYEFITAECELVETTYLLNYFVQVYNQPNTPVYAFAYWNKSTLAFINFSVKENSENE